MSTPSHDLVPGSNSLLRDRFVGAMLGLAVGDALGAAVEFAPPGSFEPVTGMRGGGPFGLPPGHWTDDTSMALCLAESLTCCGGLDPVDQLRRYVRWYREGYLSSTGQFFDIGMTTASALRKFEATGEPYCGTQDLRSSGNGSLMRLAPVPLFFVQSTALAIEMSGESSRTTHGSPICVDACRYYGGLIVGALHGESKERLVSPFYRPGTVPWQDDELRNEISSVAAGSWNREPPDIVGSGYVAKSLEAALWAFARAQSFGEGCLMAVNLGDDADTTGAIYGQLAGAYFGASGIPAAWLEALVHRDLIERLALDLLEQGHQLEEEV